MKSPSTQNYTLGKGKCYFELLNPNTGLYEGERHLGNVPDLKSNVDLTKMEHFSSMGGSKKKDKSFVLQVVPTLSLTLEEISAENMALRFMADMETISQSAYDHFSSVFEVVAADRYYTLLARKVGVWALSVIDSTGLFTKGEIITGAVSTETATVLRWIPGVGAAGTLYLSDLSGAFDVGEAISGGTSLKTADTVATQIFIRTAVSVFDTDVPATFFNAGTDYTLDPISGRIMIIAGGAAVGKDITVRYACEAAGFKKLGAFKNTAIEGRFRFISDNPVGTNQELYVWRLSLTPDGDQSYIGDEWMTMALKGEILSDEENHPTSPFLDIIIED